MNPLKGEVPLTLADGRTLVLAMDFEALIAAEGFYGKPLAATILDAKQGFVGATRALLWGALQRRQPGLDAESVGEILRTDGAAVEAAMGAALVAAFPEAKAAGDPSTGSGRAEGKQPGKARAGTSSGASGAKPGSTRTRSGGRRPKLSS